MFKTKWLVLVIVMIVGLMGFTACSDDEDATSTTSGCSGTGGKGTLATGSLDGGWDWNNWSDGVAHTTLAGTNPAAPNASSSNYYRCKGCHGWEGAGLAGGYGEKTLHANADLTSTRGATTLATHAAATLAFDAVTSYTDVPGTTTAYLDTNGANAQMTSTQLTNLRDFLNNGTTMTSVASITVTAGGTGTNPHVFDFTTGAGACDSATEAPGGEFIFENVCKSCHGSDGLLIGNLDAAAGYGGYLVDGAGKFSEAWHKVVYGENSTMYPGRLGTAYNSVDSTASATGLDAQDAANVLKYIQDNMGTCASGAKFPTDATVSADADTSTSC